MRVQPPQQNGPVSLNVQLVPRLPLKPLPLHLKRPRLVLRLDVPRRPQVAHTRTGTRVRNAVLKLRLGRPVPQTRQPLVLRQPGLPRLPHVRQQQHPILKQVVVVHRRHAVLPPPNKLACNPVQEEVTTPATTTAASVCCLSAATRRGRRWPTDFATRANSRQAPAKPAGCQPRRPTEGPTAPPTATGYASAEARAAGAAPTPATRQTTFTAATPTACEAGAAPKGTAATRRTATARPTRSATKVRRLGVPNPDGLFGHGAAPAAPPPFCIPRAATSAASGSRRPAAAIEAPSSAYAAAEAATTTATPTRFCPTVTADFREGRSALATTTHRSRTGAAACCGVACPGRRRRRGATTRGRAACTSATCAALCAGRPACGGAVLAARSFRQRGRQTCLTDGSAAAAVAQPCRPIKVGVAGGCTATGAAKTGAASPTPDGLRRRAKRGFAGCR